MAAIANVTLLNTFDEWRTRTNQGFVKLDEVDINALSAFSRANNNLGAIATANGNITSAFSRANTAYEHGNTAYIRANTAYDHANAAYARANTGGEATNTAIGAFTAANNNAGAISTSNTNITNATNTAVGAFTRANNNLGAIATANGNITSAFSKANTAYDHANAAYNYANTITGGSTVAYTNTNSNFYLTFTSNTSGVMDYAFVDDTFFYNPNTNTLTVTTVNSTSDENKKTNIYELDYTKAYDSIIYGMRGVSFNWKDNGQPSIGVIAQEVNRYYPALVDQEHMSVNYSGLVGVLISALKNVGYQLDEHQDEIRKLKDEIDILKSRMP